MTRPACVLVGIMGAGKTTVGQLVAEALGLSFRDVDDDIVATAGKPIPEIFIDDGEERFRALERAATAAALDGFDGVLALGGGAILAADTRARLAEQTVVYLSVEMADAIKRVGLGAGRPMLAMNPRATLRPLLDQRRPLYEEVATAVVHTDGRTPEEVAAEVLALIATTSGKLLPRGGSDATTSGKLLPRGGPDATTSGKLLPRGGPDATTSGKLLPQGGSDATTSGKLLPHGGSDTTTSGKL
jgi:shikimate kinase